MVAAAILLSLAACSRIDLGWRLAPALLEREGARWLGLKGDARDAFGRDVKVWLNADASRVAGELGRQGQALAAHLEQGRDEAALAALFDELPKHWDRWLAPALPLLARWMTHEPRARAAALEAAFNAANTKDRKRWLELEDPARRAERFNERLQAWTGDLNATQIAAIKDWAQRNPYPASAWIEDRQQRQQALIKALRRGADAGTIETLLRAWWIEPEPSREQFYQAALSDYRQSLRRASAQLLASLEPEQRSRLITRLRDHAEHLVAIGQAAKPAGA